MSRIELVTPVRASIEVVFDASLDVDVHMGSMASSGERAVAGVLHGRMGPGDTVTWVARHFGVRWRLTSRITAFERPRRFVDEQVRGPFRHWYHEHLFASDEGNPEITIMKDIVDFAAPGGAVGKLATALVLHRYMRHLIELRNAHLVALLSAPHRDI